MSCIGSCRWERVSRAVEACRRRGLSREEMEAEVTTLLDEDATLHDGRRSPTEVQQEVASQLRQAGRWFDKLARGVRPTTGRDSARRVALSLRVEEAKAAGGRWREAARVKCPSVVLAAMAGEAPWLLKTVCAMAGLLAEEPRSAHVTIAYDALEQVIGNVRERERRAALTTFEVPTEEADLGAEPPGSLTRAAIAFMVARGWLLKLREASRDEHAAVYFWLPPQSEEEIT